MDCLAQIYIPAAARIDFVSSATKSQSDLFPRIDPAETVERQSARSFDRFLRHIFFFLNKLIFWDKTQSFSLATQNRANLLQALKKLYLTLLNEFSANNYANYVIADELLRQLSRFDDHFPCSKLVFYHR